MKLNEQHELVLDFIKEFTEKEVAPVENEIEKNGMDRQLVNRMAERGYLGAIAPEKLGGAGLDTISYMLLLEQLAKRSPSLAFAVFMQNSIAIRLLGERDVVRDLCSGKELCSTSLEFLSKNRAHLIRFSGGRYEGSGLFLMPDATAFIATADRDGGQEVVLFRKGFRIKSVIRGLGFRGMRSGEIEFSAGNGDCEVIYNTAEEMKRTMLEASHHAAAIALGIAEGALDRTIAYARQRTAFGSRLEGFQPVAFQLSHLSARAEALREYLYRNAEGTLKDRLAARVLIYELALDATHAAMQIHGGNGYFEEYGIEKYYRDAMALSAYTSDRTDDMVNLSHFTLGKESALL